MKKKLIALVTALTLCAAVVVGTTLAYYSAQTDSVQNTFTYSPEEDPDPVIEEPNWPDPPPKVSPEKAIPKDPRITLKNDKTTLEYHAAMVISGETSTAIAALENLKGIVNKTTTDKVRIIYRVNAKGEKIKDPNSTVTDPNNPKYWLHDEEPYKENNGIATLKGWSTEFDYEIDKTTGTIYAYYKKTLKAGNLSTPPVFTEVQMYKEIQHFMDQLKTDEKDKPIFDIIVKGYVVSALDDTQLKSDGTPDYKPWASCKDAMVKAFPDVFTGHTATANPPYEN